MHKPEPGAPYHVNDETRVTAVEDRGQRMYAVEVKLGDTWQLHGAGPSESFLYAVETARRVAHRERSEREQLMSHSVMDMPGPEPWSVQRPSVNYSGELDMPTLAGKIRRARARVGMRS